MPADHFEHSSIEWLSRAFREYEVRVLHSIAREKELKNRLKKTADTIITSPSI